MEMELGEFDVDVVGEEMEETVETMVWYRQEMPLCIFLCCVYFFLCFVLCLVTYVQVLRKILQ